jgi:hypothetical protein
VVADEVPAPMSVFSTSSVLSPRPAASRATQTPVMPPPTTTTSYDARAASSARSSPHRLDLVEARDLGVVPRRRGRSTAPPAGARRRSASRPPGGVQLVDEVDRNTVRAGSSPVAR